MVDVSKLAPITFDPIDSAYHRLGGQVWERVRGRVEPEIADYWTLNAQILALFGGVSHRPANLDNAAARLCHTLDGLNCCTLWPVCTGGSRGLNLSRPFC